MKFEDALSNMLKKGELTYTGYYYLLSAYKETVAGDEMQR